jgi:inner membrane protein involved in colicin E2 resistance
MEAALETIRQKTVVGYRLTAYFLLAAGLVFGCLALFEVVKAISTGRVWAMTFAIPGLALVFIVAGIALLRMIKSKT